MGVTLERVQNKFACIIGELCSEPLLLSQFAIWVDLRISEYKSKGTISLDCSGTTPDPSWLKGHVVQPLAAASSSDNGRARSGSANIRNSLPHKSIHSSRDPGHGSNYSSNNRTDGNVDNSDVGSDRLSPDIQLIKQESDSAFPVSLHQHSARKRQSEDDLSQGENFYEDSSFSTPKVRRVDSAADETSAVDSPSNQSFMSVIGDSLQDNDDVSDNSLMMAGEDQSKGGNQSFTPRAGTSFSMPSASATPGTSSSAVPEVKKMVMSKVVDSPNTAGGLPFIDWQTATPTQHDQAWFIGRQSKRNIRARVVMCDDKAESTIRGMVNVVGILERFLQVRFNDFRRCEIIPPTELDAYLVSFFLELRKPDGRDYDPYSLSNLRSYLDRFLREHNYPYSIGVSALFTASQQAFTRKRRSLLAVRSSQKELELQVEQSLFGSPLKAGSMEVEPWKLLYTPPTADILKKMTNQAWIDAGKVEQGGKTSKSKPTESAVSSAGESAKESSAIGDTSFTNQTEQKESPSSAALKDNGQRLGGNLQGLDSSSSLASIANLTATLTQSKSQSTGDQNI